MIISRTPLRITLGGGGTDDPQFVAEHGGFCLTAAINRHIYVGINDTFEPGYLLKYSEVEHVQTIDEIDHPILRETLRHFQIPPHVEIISMADIPSGTGLGSSGAFGVGLCRTLACYRGSKIHKEDAAELAAHIELDVLGRPGGKQDHWATAIGGLLSLTFDPNGSVLDRIPAVSARSLMRLESSLALFFTGFSRDADSILSSQSRDGLEHIKEAAFIAQKYLIAGDIQSFGQVMHEHWIAKRVRSLEMSNDRIDHYYKVALENGAIGGKLVGAGGGGFLLFVTEDHERLSGAMTELGLQETPVAFDHDGSSIIARER